MVEQVLYLDEDRRPAVGGSVMNLYGVKTRLVNVGDDLVSVLLEGLDSQGLELEDGDIIAFTSKIVSVAQNRLVRFDVIKPSKKAEDLGSEYHLEPGFVEIVLNEADVVYGGVYRALLTLNNGILFANSGIDHKNVPDGFAVLLPEDPDKAAADIRREIKSRLGKHVAVIIIDSRTVPMRMGTLGVAIGVSGFNPIRDCRGEPDLYEKPLLITRMAIADDLACAAHLLMGELAEKIPIVLIRGAPVEFDESASGVDAAIDWRECLYMKIFQPKPL